VGTQLFAMPNRMLPADCNVLRRFGVDGLLTAHQNPVYCAAQSGLNGFSLGKPIGPAATETERPVRLIVWRVMVSK